MSILEPVNTGSVGGALQVETRKAIVQKISELKTVKTWTGKLANWSNRATLGAVQADLLDAMGKNCDETMTGEVLARRIVDTKKDILGSALYAVSLRTDIAIITATGFDTKAMGVW